MCVALFMVSNGNNGNVGEGKIKEIILLRGIYDDDYLAQKPP